MKREGKKKKKNEDRVGHSDNRWGQNARSHNQFVQLLMCKKKEEEREDKMCEVRTGLMMRKRMTCEHFIDVKWAHWSLSHAADEWGGGGGDIRAEINVTQVQQSSD